MRKRIIILLFILVVFLALPYVNAEILTKLHGDETKTLYEQTGIILSDNYQKIVKYNANRTEVLYITSGDISKCCFVKENENWVLDSWCCISSKKGSASSFTYPFYFYKNQPD